MIRAFGRQLDDNGRVTAVQDVSVADGLQALQTKGQQVWFDLTAPTDDDYAWLERSFDFHPLTIEDSKQHDPRAKITEFPGYLFITLHSPHVENGEQTSDEIHIFIGERYFVTVHDLDNAAIENLNALQRTNFQLSEWGTSFLFYRLSDLIVDAYFPVLDDLGDQVEALEDRIVTSVQQTQLNDVFTLKRNLVFLRKTIGPMREVFNAILIRRYPLIDERALIYLRDVYEHIIRFYDMIDSYRDLVGNALDTYLSTTSNNLNQIVKRLTIITTIFMPLTFITGFFGMNFTHLPFDNPYVFFGSLVVLIASPVSLVWWFRREKWL
ncbi:MAG: magnesium/cobalt transporter CorA [Chloroflexota bacterium]